MKPRSPSIRSHCILAALSLIIAGPASATIVLYQDDFSGSSSDPLNGTTPDTTIGATFWTANTGWRADGSISSAGVNSQNAFLPFTPVPGFVYTLTSTLNKPTGSGGGTWAAVGFTEVDVLDIGFWVAPNDAGPWILYRANNNNVAAFGGPGIGGTNSGDVGPYTGPQTFTIELDTTGPQWTAEWFVGATSIHQVTYATNPTINFVGLGRSNNAAANFSSFTLTMTPEPSAALLGTMGMLTLLLRRRRGWSRGKPARHCSRLD